MRYVVIELGVTDFSSPDKMFMTRVIENPCAGQYSFKDGVFTFSDDDAGHDIQPNVATVKERIMGDYSEPKSDVKGTYPSGARNSGS